MKSYDWLKIRVNLPDDPVVAWLSRRLGRSPDEVLGKLLRFWAWADQNTHDGSLPGAALEDVDRLVRLKGFALALCEVPKGAWLERTDDGLAIPRFEQHNGASAKRRAMERDRMRATRDPSAIRADALRTESEHDAHSRGRGRARDTDSLRSSGADTAPRDAAGDRPSPPGDGPESPHVAFRDWWMARFQATKGAPYGFDGAKDGTALAAILRLAGLRKRPPSTPGEAAAAVELAKSRAELLLTSTDHWHVEKGVDLPALRAQWNRLASAGKGGRDVRVGRADAAPHEAFPRTGRVDL